MPRKKPAVPRGHKANPQGDTESGDVATDRQPTERQEVESKPGEVSADESPAVAVVPETRARATNRWILEGRRWDVDRRRKDVIRQGIAGGLTREAAADRAWEVVMAEFPPPGVEPASPPVPEPPPTAEAPTGVTGLADLPADWPALSPNAGLQAEVAWVQANRLRCVQGNTVVLSQALGPAPSHAALSWLETSILYPSKWADVAVRATQHTEDEQAMVKRERKSIAELEAILKEMAPRCPHCGELLC